MNKVFIILLGVFVVACAKVSVETAEPIRVDINMRVDVYQHLERDVDSVIEDIYDAPQSYYRPFFAFGCAWADDFGINTEEAKQRMKMRLPLIEDYFRRGYIRENKKALIELAPDLSVDSKAAVESDVEMENADREMIYDALAKKNGVAIDAVRELFLKKHFERAVPGSLFQVYDSSDGQYLWKKK